MIKKNKSLFAMFEKGLVPLEPYVCIDTYNQKVMRDCFCTIRTTISSSNSHFITIMEDD
ncbi:hypothetical protein [Prevotella disiens]|uniref:hypothetical protein n=1 Tax=Prevotella disiens TaxID=28130 RepID=UPI002431A29B|nr:hypothetical protein [Prevotella disiens]